jgi:hypothetical protein
MINAVKERAATIMGSWGNTSLIDADIAAMSAPMFTVFAIIRRIVSGNTTFFEYLVFIAEDRPLPDTRPILAQIS